MLMIDLIEKTLFVDILLYRKTQNSYNPEKLEPT